MDLSDFTKTLNYLPDLVRYTDDDTGEDKTARQVELTWKHNSLSVSELKFYLREGHAAWDDKIRTREHEILTTWMTELNYDPLLNVVKDKKIVARGQVETQEQIDNWVKPNATAILDPTEVDKV